MQKVKKVLVNIIKSEKQELFAHSKSQGIIAYKYVYIQNKTNNSINKTKQNRTTKQPNASSPTPLKNKQTTTQKKTTENIEP